MKVACALLFATLLAEGPAVSLPTVAAAGVRPPECGGPSASAAAHGRWGRASAPRAGRYCRLLARASSELRDHPEGALEAANQAALLSPASAEAHVLAGRALVRLGRLADARSRFAAVRPDAVALEGPGALRDRASAALGEGELAEARRVLVALVPRAALLDDPADVVRVHVEAAALAMWEGERGLDEAIALLSRARRVITTPELDELVLAMYALALDRAGRHEEATAAVAQLSGPWRLQDLFEPDPREASLVELPRLPPGELEALLAVASEAVDVALAAARWRAFIEARGEGSFVEHARKHLARRGPR